MGRPPVPFWDRVDRSGSCWLWTGARNSDGYGTVRWRGRDRVAHRVALELTNGTPPPDDLEVCHSCDTPACVRPDHLWLGTHAQNMADRNRKGRTARGTQTAYHGSRAKGSRNGHAKLTEDAIKTIRSRRRAGEHLKTIAGDYGVTIGTIWKVAAGHNWRHA